HSVNEIAPLNLVFSLFGHSSRLLGNLLRAGLGLPAKSTRLDIEMQDYLFIAKMIRTCRSESLAATNFSISNTSPANHKASCTKICCFAASVPNVLRLEKPLISTAPPGVATR